MKLMRLAFAAALIASQAMAETGASPDIEAQLFGYDDAADESGACRGVQLTLADQALWVKLSDQFVATEDKNLRALYQKGRDEFESKFARNGKVACSAAGASAAYRSAFYK
ncbi:hypothetical protein [Rhizobium ruizarguesonis]|uniref:hypothetical protein n=1 Tax=Rhizobium ruizarguesonis TaxID=2081791 RepID=UPI00103065B8|nr:hypothetical protein [Rhizobium ruizarguesonis]TBF08913.1 hypothetical protein ELG96_09505 [Rhizobium ruizarguesonis]